MAGGHPGSGYNVDPEQLDSAGSKVSRTAEVIGRLRAEQAFHAGPAGLPGTATAAAAQQVALRMSAGLAAYAVETSSIGTRTGDAAENYRVIDSHVAEAMIRLAGRA